MKTDWLKVVVLALLISACDQKAEPEKGFAGMGDAAEHFTAVVPDRPFSFPQDHGPHPGFRIEWWYITANLQDDQGRHFGVQWTLFRSALRADATGTGWNDGTIWMGHAALTSATQHRVAERYARGGVEQAGVTLTPLTAWIDDWSLRSTSSSADPLAALQLNAKGPGFAYQLALQTQKNVVLQGRQGFSQKSDQGQASYYYSQPFFQAEGDLHVDGKTYRVSGPAWLDREWSSQPLTANQTGWDWFSMHLQDGAELMLYRMRHKEGAAYLTGTWINADGSTQLLEGNDISLTPLENSNVAGRQIPTRWSVKIPGKGLDITTTALNPQAWMGLQIPYWEGPITFNGSQKGVGYLEMTGY